MAVTIEEIQTELSGQQIVMSDFVLTRLLAKVQAQEVCMRANNYSEDDIDLIYVYLLTMMGLFGADGRIRSQSAPSGASQSFQFGSLGERWKALSDVLRGLDPEGCIASLIPPDPDKKAHCALFVSPGECM